MCLRHKKGASKPGPWHLADEVRGQRIRACRACRPLWGLGFYWSEVASHFRVMSEGVITIKWNHLDCVWKRLLVAGDWHRAKVEKWGHLGGCYSSPGEWGPGQKEGMNERWLKSSYILKIEPTGFTGFGYEVCENTHTQTGVTNTSRILAF